MLKRIDSSALAKWHAKNIASLDIVRRNKPLFPYGGCSSPMGYLVYLSISEFEWVVR